MTTRTFIENGASVQLRAALATIVGRDNSIIVISVSQDSESYDLTSDISNVPSIIVQILIHSGNVREAESIVGVLTSDQLNKQLSSFNFPTVSIVEPWPQVQPYDARIAGRGGEALPYVQLQALDKGGNIADDDLLNVSIILMEKYEVVRLFECKGQSSCLVPVNSSIPAGHVLIEAFVDVSVQCTDFDYVTEKVTQLSLGGSDLTKLAVSPLITGPFPKCYASCDTHESILSSYSVLSQVRQTAVNDEDTFDIMMSVSPDVNLFPCDGYLLSALVSLRITSAAPSDPSNFAGAALAQFQGSYDLNSSAIRRCCGEGYLISFTSPGIRGTELYWIRVTAGSPVNLILLQQPPNSTGGLVLSSQPRVAIVDAGSNIVYDLITQVVVHVLLSNISSSCAYEPPSSEINGCTAKFCHFKIGTGLQNRITYSIDGENLSGLLHQQVNGPADFTDLALNVAAVDYRLSFTAVSLETASLQFQAIRYEASICHRLCCLILICVAPFVRVVVVRAYSHPLNLSLAPLLSPCIRRKT